MSKDVRIVTRYYIANDGKLYFKSMLPAHIFEVTGVSILAFGHPCFTLKKIN